MKEKIIKIVKDNLIYDVEINEYTAFSELSLDSLLFIQIIVMLENEFNIELKDEQLNILNYQTVNDLINVVINNEKNSLQN